MDRDQVEQEIEDLRRDLRESVAGRSRLTLIVTLIGIIGICLWAATVVLITLVYPLKDSIREDRGVSVEQLQNSCFSYHERTGKISPICARSHIVNGDGSLK